MSKKQATFQSKAGTYDRLVGADGKEAEVFIVEDTPTYMVVEILERGTRLKLAKHVQ